ncbi:Oidioi.mRNA.OKI2018_I69.PAR.g12622.t1.cds [Oikopleura dioica]|uniref:Oidioi.mRNA.OKI2018_I69.PAR.g12622.t1.cds n=1 Tax=Oikopleura dioica TaxID=34765 RepID=A0ABN7S731_OIKDI|nr:Oidioi.mRNA.OKI2018_I69.PAR.g12622.t1.cds [Oikopleura dioica]
MRGISTTSLFLLIFSYAQEITVVDKIFSSDVNCEATEGCDPENDPKHPQRVAICKANVPHEESTDLTFYFDGQRRNSAADMVCENINNQTVCEVSLTLTEPITRDMHQSEVKCVYADERDDIERESTAKLNVLHPPTVSMIGDQRMFKDENVLNCTASGYPTPIIGVNSLVQKEISKSYKGESLDVTDGIAIIPKETKWDQVIVCYAQNGINAVAEKEKNLSSAQHIRISSCLTFSSDTCSSCIFLLRCKCYNPDLLLLRNATPR